MKTLTLITLMVLSGCTSVNVSTYTGVDYHNQNDLVGLVELEARYGKQYACKYVHRSDITRGAPFNERGESDLDDMVLCGATFEIWVK